VLSVEDFLLKAISLGAIEFPPGGRKLSSGRMSPYMIDMGQFSDGSSIVVLAELYAAQFDANMRAAQVIFGPAYKGISLAVALGIALDKEFVYNRKEEKGHGEGGVLVGRSMKGKDVVIVEDAMTTSASCEKAVAQIQQAGGRPIGCVVGMDRQEWVVEGDRRSALRVFESRHGISVHAVATFKDLISLFARCGTLVLEHRRITSELLAYQNVYGAKE
jgi:orotate phosphoribosyltransferase